VVKLSDVRFPGNQQVVGLDEMGREKTHSRTDHLKYRIIDPSDGIRLFANPIPVEQRAKPPLPGAGAPPPGKS
jgi:hypothetical protein